MRLGRRLRESRFGQEEGGTAVVEFAIVASVLLLLVFGILDFGHAWYMRHLITNASREGARYAVIYQVRTDGSRKPPSEFTPSVESVVNNYLTGLLPDGSWHVTPGGAGYSSGAAGQEVNVTVTTDKTWFAVHSLMQLFGTTLPQPTTLTAQTIMRCE